MLESKPMVMNSASHAPIKKLWKSFLHEMEGMVFYFSLFQIHYQRLRDHTQNIPKTKESKIWTITYSWNSTQQLPLGLKKVAVVERFKQESMYGLLAKKVAVVDRWPLLGVWLYKYLTIFPIDSEAMRVRGIIVLVKSN